MGKAKKSTHKEARLEEASEAAAHDPHAVLRHPAKPSRPNVGLFLLATVLFLAWFIYLVYVAWRG